MTFWCCPQWFISFRILFNQMQCKHRVSSNRRCSFVVFLGKKYAFISLPAAASNFQNNPCHQRFSVETVFHWYQHSVSKCIMDRDIFSPIFELLRYLKHTGSWIPNSLKENFFIELHWKWAEIYSHNLQNILLYHI